MRRFIGKIKFVKQDKKYGFILEPDLTERFMHLNEWKAFADATKGMLVSFTLKPALCVGKPDEAADVRPATEEEILAQLGKAALAGGGAL